MSSDLFKINPISSLDIKDKFLIIRSDRVTEYDISQYFQELGQFGCLGFILLPFDSEIDAVGKEELKKMIGEL